MHHHDGSDKRFVRSGTVQLHDNVDSSVTCFANEGHPSARIFSTSTESSGCCCRDLVPVYCKAVLSRTLAVRRVGNMFYDRDFAEVPLRHLLHTRTRMTLSLTSMQCDYQLRVCVSDHVFPRNAKTPWSIAGDVVQSLDVSSWKRALYECLHSSDGFRVLSFVGPMKIGMGVRRYERRKSHTGIKGSMTTGRMRTLA